MTADESWGMFCALKNTVWFNQNLKEQMNGKLVFTLRSQEEIDSLVKKADAKGKEAELRLPGIPNPGRHSGSHRPARGSGLHLLLERERLTES